ncbi:MAG TPA: DUF885 domain-containing protein [Gemmatimonadaceae bacterium]|nr:DUF885 domain-containing protein [Gemmatimonadaceae bacterium]
MLRHPFSFVRLSTLVISVFFLACVNAEPGETAASSTASSTSVSSGTSPALAHFVDTYFDSLYSFSPSQGTAAGFHQYDNKVEDLSAANVNRRIGTLHAQQNQLDSIRLTKLALDDSIDAAMIDGAIKSELQDEEEIANWKKNPMNYVGLPGNAVDLLMKRTFASPVERLRSVTARLRGVPAVLTEMRENVVNPPKEFTDLATRIAAGSVGFFKADVATWAKGAADSDSSALREFTQVNDSVVASMQSSADWLKGTLLPKSNGKFAIGAKAFADKLRYDEMVDIPLPRLLAIGEAQLDKDYKAFVATAQEVAPGKTPEQAMETLNADHPTAANLISSAKATVEGARQFLIDHKIVDIPSNVLPIVTETPPYARSGTFASMDTPGAYETKAKEAFYYVTPPEKDWDAKHVEEHLKLYNKSVMDIITVHEVFPGHFLQFIYAPQFPTKTRKLLGAASNAEGWAHYGEQMMVEEGFGNHDPKTRLAQLSEALLRDCRWVVGMKEHTQGMSVQAGATNYFTKKCFQQPANAYEEARRGAYNPTYLYYTLGKLEIYKLRSDYQKLRGSNYSLREFHDAFVKQGFPPIKMVRRLMLPNDTTSVL